MASDVFISYCRENSAEADRICSFLEQNNLQCWVAPRNIPGGMEWPEAIAKGIQGSRIMLVLLSSHTQRSKQIGRELTLAANHDLTVITVRLEDVGVPDSLQYFVSNLQWIDVYGDHFNEGMAKLIATLRYQLGRTGDTEKNIRVDPAWTSGKKGLSKGKKVALAAGLVFAVFCVIAYEANLNRSEQNDVMPAKTVPPSITPAPDQPPEGTPKQSKVKLPDTLRKPPADSTSSQRPFTQTDTSSDQDSEPPSSSVHESPPAMTAASFGQLTAGTWRGAYACAGIVNEAQLLLTSEGNGGVSGLFRFNALPQPGAYYVRGKVSPADHSIYLKYAGWQYKPPGDWVPLDVMGIVDLANETIKGRMNSPLCTGFEVHRQ
ncbi:MAG: toll/interleukin-1 receptor domain-containing protein [Acidobacteriaceae bacterium]|nr:toll/interleukin-1 receptor domain-containing protein [Acidobacteriaceae bacterium]